MARYKYTKLATTTEQYSTSGLFWLSFEAGKSLENMVKTLLCTQRCLSILLLRRKQQERFRLILNSRKKEFQLNIFIKICYGFQEWLVCKDIVCKFQTMRLVKNMHLKYHRQSQSYVIIASAQTLIWKKRGEFLRNI